MEPQTGQPESIPWAQYAQLQSDHEALQKKYKALLRDYNLLGAMAEGVKQKYKTAKEMVKEWKAYIESKNAVVAQHPGVATAETHSSSPPARGTGRGTTSSQTTEGELAAAHDDHPSEHDSGNSSKVEVVSARAVKRPRESSRQQSQTRDQAGRNAFVKKEKYSSSSPLRADPGPVHILRTETSDLDATVNGDIDTPRRRRQRMLGLDQLQHYHDTGSFQPLPSHSTNAQQSRPATPRTAGPLQSLSSNTPSHLSTGTIARSAQRKRTHIDAIHHLSEDGDESLRGSKKPKTSSGESTPRASVAARLRNLLEADGNPVQEREVLTPRSVATVRKLRAPLSRPPDSPSNRQRQPDQDQTDRHGQEDDTPRAKALSKTSFGQRVSSTEGTTSRPSPRTRATPQENSKSMKLEHATRSRTSPRKRPMPDDGTCPVKPEDEPLRSRPLYRLNPDDFKVNPKYSETGFAYADSVRKRDERKRLPGNAREFTRLAEVGGIPHVQKRRGLWDTDDMSDDELTLRGYLGAGYEHAVQGATIEQRNKLLVDARAQSFADKFGRQRQIFERPASPPGFWNVDFPTTQEELEMREEAQRRERDTVEERWREAMRGNGRYVFRDE